jgi:uncharacterized protein YjbJ (UPF0337 family)
MTSPMWNRIAGNWKQLKGEVQKKWGRITNDDLDQVEGIYEQLAGKIQERYGVAQQEAYRQIDEWADEIKSRIS